MEELGSVLHVGKNIIAISTGKVKINASVVTKDQKPVGTVHDIFGPVDKPYLFIRSSSNIELRKGDKIYTSP